MLFCHYRYLAVEYLLVAVLSNLSSMRVNENLDINPTHYLMDHADIVARIGFQTEWETNPESTRYLTFLKGRVGAKWRISLWISWGQQGLNAKAQTVGCCKRLMISLPKHNWIKQSDRTCASRFIATVMRRFMQDGEIELESLSKELAGVAQSET